MKPIAFVEGGGPPINPLPAPPPGIVNLAPQLNNGRYLLQNALYQLFEKAVPSLNLIFDIIFSGGWPETAHNFVIVKKQSPERTCALIIDYQDINGINRQEKYNTIKAKVEDDLTGVDLSDLNHEFIEPAPNIFFMVQSMDSWILSQPHIIEQEFLNLEKDSEGFNSALERLQRKHVTEWLNAFDQLNLLVGYFKEERKGKMKKVKYHKIQTVVRLLPLLNIDQLQDDFDDVRRFVEYIQQ